ncbi:MAG: HEAT repeat domain-containing protein [Planctomycetes bacterium]|nr:HEAT repeat domain-containing protein [Planctomycetota bacterium]
MQRRRPGRSCSPFAVLLLSALAAAQTPGPEADLRSKSVDTRLAAIDALGQGDRADVDRLLLPLLKDKDWEIQERAAIALGKAKCVPAVKALVELAVDGDCVRIRRAAAQAAAAIDPAEAASGLCKKAKGRTQVAALEALALANRRQAPLADADKLKKLLRDESAALREAAATAWLECAADRAETLRALLAEPFLAVRCRALDAIAESPRQDDLKPLADLLRGGAHNEVVERRLLRALAAVLAEGHADLAGRAADVLQGAGTEGLAAVRRARLAALLAHGDKPVFDQKQAVAALKPCLTADGAARAAASKSLREVGGEEALAAALAHWPRETDRRVQLQLVGTVGALRPATTPEAVNWLAEIARGGGDDAVRERAIVLLGTPGADGAAATLIEVLGERQWTLACCAAVSLGKTKADAAFAPLSQLLQHAEWTHRGAGVVGLMHWNRAAAFELLIGMLDDGNGVVAGAAHAALQTMSLQFELGTKAKAWRAWWAANKDTHQFVDRTQSIDKLKKYGYAVPDTEIYQGLDVVVFKSRGDHIEQLLERLKIAHRETEAGAVPTCGIHPEAIFVSNCTGEIKGEDLLPLAWFVRTGGSLFGSCWALSETIERIQPGVVQKARTSDQVLDDVRALPCRADSPLLTGVFPPAVVPIYHLEGAHLIDVLDPERCEVLIDSPDAAERWGCGNLAAWFFCGHGVLFDSANHFDLQGLETQKDLKTAEERQAYAVDHMGLSFDTLRATRSAGYWKQQKTVGKNVPDLSAFRLLTNFVRSKRMGEY